MTQALPANRNTPTRSTSPGTLMAIAVFVVVYLGVLLVTFAPREMIAAQSGSVVREAD